MTDRELELLAQFHSVLQAVLGEVMPFLGKGMTAAEVDRLHDSLNEGVLFVAERHRAALARGS